MQFGPVLGGEAHMSQGVMLGCVHEGGQFRPALAHRARDMAEGLMGAFGVGLDEGLAQGHGGGFYPSALDKGTRTEHALNGALAKMYV
jgi:hypothetical protein